MHTCQKRSAARLLRDLIWVALPVLGLRPVACNVQVCIASPSPPLGPRNIILIMADDLGYHSLSMYGTDAFLTPNLDRLARPLPEKMQDRNLPVEGQAAQAFKHAPSSKGNL